MSIYDLKDLSFMASSAASIVALKEATEKNYWIKFSTPYWKNGQICGGELPHIFDRHLKAAIEEMEQYLAGIEVKRL